MTEGIRSDVAAKRDSGESVLSAVPELDAAKDAPVFIIGYKRSGTTLLRKILNSHPGLAIPTESEYFQKVPSIEAHSKEALAERLAKLSRCDFGSGWSAQDIAQFLRRADVQEPKDVIAALYIKKGIEEGKSGFRWGDKKPQHWKFIATLLNWYPRAQVIHITRNPYDVISSIEKWMPDQVIGRKMLPSHLISAWQWDYSERYVERQCQRFDAERYIGIRYEEFARNPKEVLARICRFLNLRFDERLLSAYREDQRDTKLHNQATTQSISDKNVGKGRHYFTPQQQVEIALMAHQPTPDVEVGLWRKTLARVKVGFLRFCLDLAWLVRRSLEKRALKI